MRHRAPIATSDCLPGVALGRLLSANVWIEGLAVPEAGMMDYGSDSHGITSPGEDLHQSQSTSHFLYNSAYGDFPVTQKYPPISVSVVVSVVSNRSHDWWNYSVFF